MLKIVIPQLFGMIRMILLNSFVINGDKKIPEVVYSGDYIWCGAYGTRTRDPMRDRHVF